MIFLLCSNAYWSVAESVATVFPDPVPDSKTKWDRSSRVR